MNGLSEKERAVVKQALAVYRAYMVSEEEEPCDDIRAKDLEYAIEDLIAVCEKLRKALLSNSATGFYSDKGYEDWYK